MGDRYNKNMDEANAGPVDRWFAARPWVIWAGLWAVSIAILVGFLHPWTW